MGDLESHDCIETRKRSENKSEGVPRPSPTSIGGLGGSGLPPTPPLTATISSPAELKARPEIPEHSAPQPPTSGGKHWPAVKRIYTTTVKSFGGGTTIKD